MNDSESKVLRKKPGILKLAKASQFNSWYRIVFLFLVLLGTIYAAFNSISFTYDRIKRAKEISNYCKIANEEVSRCYEVRNKLQEGGHLWLLIKDTKTGASRTVDVKPHTFMSKEKGDHVWFKYTKKELGEAGVEPKNVAPTEIWGNVIALVLALFISGYILYEDGSYLTDRKERRYNEAFKDKGYEIIPNFEMVNREMKKYFFIAPILVSGIVGFVDLVVTIIIEV